jgi:hypothetical protein
MKDLFGKEFSPTEMYKLINLLINAKIPFEVVECYGTPQVCYPSAENRICDAICHSGSYGHEQGLLEIMGLNTDPTDDVEGWLTAEEVYKRILQDYESKGYIKGRG